ncbi:uncharacterized protein LOC125139265 [Tachysurus fulvidraco]|uniref:uncharacterized protein LOC125139265 n=1 Tax=Tachysurus fulvidraco TaxID=1234273 RepID=UPI001FED5D90|nr:uncharacterized protein LOC125139265 [Tachysurus fulvidraco]
MKHILSYSRFVYMILNNRDEDLNIVFKVKVNGEEFVIFATSGVLKCFGCGQEGHMFRNCPEKEVDGGQETGLQKEKDKRDSEGNNVHTDRQEEITQENSNTEGQEGKEKTNEPEAGQMETGKENPQVNNDNPEQNTETVGHQSSEESVAKDNTDLITADAGFTVVRSKRKYKASGSGLQTRKKGLVETVQEQQSVNSQEAVMESGSEQDTNTDTDSDEDKLTKDQAGGDFNCTQNDLMDRNHTEPHAASKHTLTRLIKTHDLVDVWRRQHGNERQYTRVELCPLTRGKGNAKGVLWRY